MKIINTYSASTKLFRSLSFSSLIPSRFSCNCIDSISASYKMLEQHPNDKMILYIESKSKTEKIWEGLRSDLQSHDEIVLQQNVVLMEVIMGALLFVQ